MESVPWMETRMAPERKQIRSGLSPPPYRNLISTAIIKTHTDTNESIKKYMQFFTPRSRGCRERHVVTAITIPWPSTSFP